MDEKQVRRWLIILVVISIFLPTDIKDLYHPVVEAIFAQYLRLLSFAMEIGFSLNNLLIILPGSMIGIGILLAFINLLLLDDEFKALKGLYKILTFLSLPFVWFPVFLNSYGGVKYIGLFIYAIVVSLHPLAEILVIKPEPKQEA